MPIDTVEDLKDHLRLAIEVEMTTIPLYLYAMYSIVDPASDASKLIRSVATEEMLHAALVANLLIAIGGEPRFYDPTHLPTYPCPLPHHVPELMLDLAPCSPEVIRKAFLVIEQPADREAPPEADAFETLGQFYHALENALTNLAAQGDLFANPSIDRQLEPADYSPVKFDTADSGGLVIVDSLESALEALEIVIHQGEGLSDDKWADPSHQELTHYAKFLALADGEIPIGDVHPAVVNPSTASLPEAIRPVGTFFNAIYSYLLILMDRAYEPMTSDQREPAVGLMYGAMEALMRPVARYLFSLETEAGRAGPPFEFHRFEHASSALDELRSLGAALVDQHPQLSGVVGALDRF